MNEKIKYILSVLGGLLATATKQYGLILLFVIIGIFMDCITGLIKSKIIGKGWSSKVGFVGFWKKVSLLAALFFGIFLDYFIPTTVEKIVTVELPFALPFGLIEMNCRTLVTLVMSKTNPKQSAYTEMCM